MSYPPRPAAAPLQSTLERAVARGGLSRDLDPDLAGDLIVGPIAVRLFFSGRKLQPKMVSAMVELALRGLRDGGSQR